MAWSSRRWTEYLLPDAYHVRIMHRHDELNYCDCVDNCYQVRASMLVTFQHHNTVAKSLVIHGFRTFQRKGYGDFWYLRQIIHGLLECVTDSLQDTISKLRDFSRIPKFPLS